MTRVGAVRGVVATLLLGVLVGCSTSTPDPREATPTPSGAGQLHSAPADQGAAWAITTASGLGQLSVIGETAVALDGSGLVGLRRSDGSELWRLPYGEKSSFTVAGDLVVVQAQNNGPVEIVNASGAKVWTSSGTAHTIVREDAVYLDSCIDVARPARGCTLTARRVTDGKVLWTVEDTPFELLRDVIGGRKPIAPPASAYLPVQLTGRPAKVAELDARTGKLLGGRTSPQAWHVLALDQTLVVTDHDAPTSDRSCTVAVTAVDGRTGVKKWSGDLYSGRRKDGSCEKALGDYETGHVAVGAGNRAAVVDASGRPQLVDLTTGKSVWRADREGVPIDGDEHTLLIRRWADEGEITLLSMADGRELWTAPDPGLSGRSASWRSIVTDKLVAVSGAEEDRVHVLVYDVATGKELARRSGWLAGAGSDWVANTSNAGAAVGKLRLAFLTF